MKLELEIRIDSLGDALRIAAMAVAALAILQELQKPPAARTWRGEVGGVVPYDFRAPTLDRMQAAYWNPANPDLFTPMPFGVGWAINIPTLARNLGRWVQQVLGEARTRLMARQ